MAEILNRLLASGEFEVVYFGDTVIHEQPVELWPQCDALISFYSDGFPLEKAEAYAALRTPYLVNDLAMQHVLLDRRLVYKVLQQHNIAVPPHAIVSRDAEGVVQGCFEETSKGVTIDGVTITKPLVEKPVSGEDHNVYVYYPDEMGGGGKRLFRKQEDRSGEFCPDLNCVRRDGSYMYETYLPTAGTDVKVYTVGPSYAHAEARKSPTVDGRVQRSADGKEVRYPVLLSTQEKEIARAVCLAFRQTVCGFDLLRCSGKSYVCDVNGWSFVKGSSKYYGDTAQTLRSHILSAIAPHLLARTASMRSVSDLDLRHANSPRNSMPGGGTPVNNDIEELRCVLAVIRHGDRTPKQKMKLRLRDKAFMRLYERHRPPGGRFDQIKLKSAEQLSGVLDATREMLGRLEAGDACGMHPDEDRGEKTEKLRVMVAVLCRKSNGGETSSTVFSGINRKVQLKPVVDTSVEPHRLLELLVVVKHGGVLTHAGRTQAESLGQDFRRSIYPAASGEGGEDGAGLLRLHSTYRHDLKIWSSDEGRVQMSAAAFAKGLLDLEGTSLAPILASLVNLNGRMLDACDKGASESIQEAKATLAQYMCGGAALTPLPERSGGSLSCVEGSEPASPLRSASTLDASKLDVSELDGSLDAPPLELMRQLLVHIVALREEIQERIWEGRASSAATDGSAPPRLRWRVGLSGVARVCACSEETLFMLLERWRKLERGLYNARRGTWEVSKIPDIYDAAKYDALHHQRTWQLVNLPPLYALVKQLANVVIPNEYGISGAQKYAIGASVCSVLVGKILRDFAAVRDEASAAWGAEMAPTPPPSGSESEESDEPGHRLHPHYADDVNSKNRHVRTRLYYTSESHMHALLNVIRYCHLGSEEEAATPLVSPLGEELLAGTRELDYLSTIVLRMYERPNVEPSHPCKFRIEILFSPGAVGDPFGAPEGTHALPVLPREPLNDGELTLHRVECALGSVSAGWRAKGCPELAGSCTTLGADEA